MNGVIVSGPSTEKSSDLFPRNQNRRTKDEDTLNSSNKTLASSESGDNNKKHLVKSPPRKRCGTNVTHSSRLIAMLSLTFMFFIIELVFGYISHSIALIADSFHMMSDVMALLVAYACLRIAEKDTKQNTFGWVRAEVLGALVNGVFLLALCFSIMVESIQRLFEPQMITEPRNVLIVGSIGFVINIIGMSMFHGHSHSGVEDREKGALSTEISPDKLEGAHLLTSHQDCAMALADLKKAAEESLITSPPSKSHKRRGGDHLNMRAVFLHILSDAIGSVIVICTALVSWLLPGYEGLKLYMDPSLSICMVLLMVCTTLPLVRETALILLQTTPKFIDLERLQNELLNIEGVEALHDLHVWRLVHIKFNSLRDYLLVAEQIRILLHEHHIHSATIQPEFPEMKTSSNGADGCVFACLPNNCSMIDGEGPSLVTCCDKIVIENRKSPTTKKFPTMTQISETYDEIDKNGICHTTTNDENLGSC